MVYLFYTTNTSVDIAHYEMHMHRAKDGKGGTYIKLDCYTDLAGKRFIRGAVKQSSMKFVCFCCFTSQVNSYGHCETVSSLNHTFSWAGLNKRLTSNLCTYFRL